MSTPASSISASIASTAKSFILLLLADAFSVGESPVLTFLAAFGASNGDPVKIKAALAALVGEEIGALPGFEGLVFPQIASKLSDLVKAEAAKVG